jgi:hypothetical protein
VSLAAAELWGISKPELKAIEEAIAAPNLEEEDAKSTEDE